jgi:transcriptional regulator with XRE-family HTH domain
MDRPKPNARKRLLANKLRRLREDAGLTQVEAGEPMRFNKNKMSRIELGHLPDYNGFLALLDRYGVIVSDYDGWIRQYDRAWEKGWWHAYGLDDKGYIALEADADEVRTYQLGFVPGLLQTKAGMRATFAGARDPMSGRRLENEIAVRLRRQTRLTEDPQLKFHAIIDESVLRRPDLLPDEQCAQLEHILERTAATPDGTAASPSSATRASRSRTSPTSSTASARSNSRKPRRSTLLGWLSATSPISRTTNGTRSS